MAHSFPTPAIATLKRQQVNDGLLLNAERWQRAHAYHRQRQNVHYQSLNQPGIVCGLGVQVIPPPEEVAAEYRDQRWVKIQPGIAIDLEGNLIIVPQALNFRITTEVKKPEPLTIYVVAQYRDPDQLENSSPSEVVQETFRIDERSRPPGPLDVELCRLLLREQQRAISMPSDVFFPGYGDIDLRYRHQAQARPQGLVQIAELQHDDPDCSRNYFNLTYLSRSIEDIYPALRGADSIDQVTWDHDLQPYELLYLTGNQGLSLNSRQCSALAAYLNRGGTLFIDAPSEAKALIQSVQRLAQQLQTPLKSLQESRRDHPLRVKPFLFSALPQSRQARIQLLSGGGIILSIGNLAGLWGLDEAMLRSRTEIRTAQELGLNILHFAWKRRQMIDGRDPTSV